MKKGFLIFLSVTVLLLSACASISKEYENHEITIELPDGKEQKITIGEIRALPQHDLDASYQRTTGLIEKFKMRGPYLAEVLKNAGIDIKGFEGIGISGSDGYYCLFSNDVIEKTPDLMLALRIDGKDQLGEDLAPAQMAAQGQFGPYWVKKVARIKLYGKMPEKHIKNVWIFKNLAEGIEPYSYEYYGSKDDAIDLEQIWARLDHVDTSAFFTLKSSDGFFKNEAMNMVLKRYYIKTEGEDAPTNISPNIKLGMNVQHISWCSSNEDAMLFPEELEKYIEKADIDGKNGLPLGEILLEVQVGSIPEKTFEIIGIGGERRTITGEDIDQAIMTIDGGKYSVVFTKELGLEPIDNLLKITEKTNLTDASPSSGLSGQYSDKQEGNPTAIPSGDGDEAILSISGDGVSKEVSLSLSQIKAMKEGYLEQKFSALNNWPSLKEFNANGIDMEYLLRFIGLSDSAKTIKLTGEDGYFASFTVRQLFEERFFYPKASKSSKEGALSVKPIIAWEYAENDNVPETGDLRNYIGQVSLSDVNTAASVQHLNRIEVITANPGSWDPPQCEIEENGGDSLVTIYHDSMDFVKIYYTLDGTDPNADSPVYNPSTSYYQPDLIVPIKAKSGDKLKLLVKGFGKNDSTLLTVDI